MIASIPASDPNPCSSVTKSASDTPTATKIPASTTRKKLSSKLGAAFAVFENNNSPSFSFVGVQAGNTKPVKRNFKVHPKFKRSSFITTPAEESKEVREVGTSKVPLSSIDAAETPTNKNERKTPEVKSHRQGDELEGEERLKQLSQGRKLPLRAARVSVDSDNVVRGTLQENEAQPVLSDTKVDGPTGISIAERAKFFEKPRKNAPAPKNKSSSILVGSFSSKYSSPTNSLAGIRKKRNDDPGITMQKMKENLRSVDSCQNTSPRSLRQELEVADAKYEANAEGIPSLEEHHNCSEGEEEGEYFELEINTDEEDLWDEKTVDTDDDLWEEQTVEEELGITDDPEELDGGSQEGVEGGSCYPATTPY